MTQHYALAFVLCKLHDKVCLDVVDLTCGGSTRVSSAALPGLHSSLLTCEA